MSPWANHWTTRPDAWTVRVFHKPFINWLWFGALMMVIGGFLAASDRRYRIAVKATAPAPAQGRRRKGA